MNPLTNLTADDIRAMEVGRELDALVAEHIFGDTICDRRFGDWPRSLKTLDRTLRYSTDIAAAWQVIHVLEKQGYRIAVESPYDLGEVWRVNIGKHGLINWTEWNGDAPLFWANAETAPEAICKATLLYRLAQMESEGKEATP